MKFTTNIFAEPVQRAFEHLQLKTAEYVFFPVDTPSNKELAAIRPKEGFNQTSHVISLGRVNSIESFYDMINKKPDTNEFEFVGYGNDPKTPDFLIVREKTGTEKYAIPLGKMPALESMVTSIRFADITHPVWEGTALPVWEAQIKDAEGIEDLRKQYPSTSQVEEIKTAAFAYGFKGTLVFRTNDKDHPAFSSQDVFNAMAKAQNKVYRSEVLNGNKYAVTSIPTKDWRTFFTAYNGNLTSFPAVICSTASEINQALADLHQSNKGDFFVDAIIKKDSVKLYTPVGRYEYPLSAVGAINNVIVQSAAFAEKYERYTEQYDAMTGKEQKDVESAMINLCSIDYENATAYPYAVVRAAGHLEKCLSFKGLLQLKNLCDQYEIPPGDHKFVDVEMDIALKLAAITEGEDRELVENHYNELEDERVENYRRQLALLYNRDYDRF